MSTIISAIIIFGLLIFVHEFGHFSTAKLLGVKVHEFAIGMGPQIFKKRKGETEYSIRAIPIGGYVKMEGEDEDSDDERSFGKKPLWAKFIILVAGSFMNILFATIIVFIMFFSFGFPTNVVDHVMDGYPAKSVGISAGDEIISINDVEIKSWEDILKNIEENSDGTVRVTVNSESGLKTFEMEPILSEENRYIIGIEPKKEKMFFQSWKYAFLTIGNLGGQMIGFFGTLFKGQASTDSLVGPVGIVKLVGEAARTNIYDLLSLTALISLNLGVINLLPLPALDGGRVLLLVVQGITRKKIDPEKEGFIHFVGFVLLMALMLFITYKDIIKIF